MGLFLLAGIFTGSKPFLLEKEQGQGHEGLDVVSIKNSGIVSQSLKCLAVRVSKHNHNMLSNLEENIKPFGISM